MKEFRLKKEHCNFTNYIPTPTLKIAHDRSNSFWQRCPFLFQKPTALIALGRRWELLAMCWCPPRLQRGTCHALRDAMHHRTGSAAYSVRTHHRTSTYGTRVYNIYDGCGEAVRTIYPIASLSSSNWFDSSAHHRPHHITTRLFRAPNRSRRTPRRGERARFVCVRHSSLLFMLHLGINEYLIIITPHASTIK